MEKHDSESVLSSLSRRNFLKITGIAAGGMMLPLNMFGLKYSEAALGSYYPYTKWEDLYKKQWTWDDKVRGCNAVNCVGGCSFEYYVRNGIVWREEQTANYDADNPDLPDYNPKGCQKGVAGSFTGSYTLGPLRIKYPMKRVGKRGEGKFIRINWEQAMSEIAEKFMDIYMKEGPEAITFNFGTSSLNILSFLGQPRLCSFLNTNFNSNNGSVNDLVIGSCMVWGTHNSAPGPISTAYVSKYTILWGINPSVTRIPHAHFFWESRYNGSKIIVIDPNYSPSAIHADTWLPIKPGTDAALAMGMAQVIVSENLYDVDHLKVTTDMPFLVDKQTRRFLRESDMEKGGKDDIFYMWDQKKGEIFKAPGSWGDEKKSVDYGDRDPALEGEWRVKTNEGEVVVQPVFAQLKEQLNRDYTPEKISAITGIQATVIREITREYAKTKPAMIVQGLAMVKFYHSDLMGRAMILLAALTGNVGRVGGGFQNWALWGGRGIIEFGRLAELEKKRLQADSVYLMVHGEYDEVAKKHFGEALVAENKKKMHESIDNKWFPCYPKPGKNPKAVFFLGDNFAVRTRSNEHVLKTLIPKYDLIVELNVRYSSTSFYSDYILPSSDHHEKVGAQFYSLFPFVNAIAPGQKPQGESDSDWGILKNLVKYVQKEALKRGIKSYDDKEMKDVVNFETLYQNFTENGKLEKDEDVMDYILENSMGIENDPDAKAKGKTYKVFAKKGHFRTMPHGDPEYDNEFPDPIPSLRWKTRVQKKLSWPTLTGRQQFYMDHPWFLELGEELPMHKDLIASKNFPYVLNTPHNRWGIHTSWRFEKNMLRLNRGEPVMYVGPDIAKAKGLKDWDKVKVFNELGDFKVRVKITSFVRPNTVMMYHAWEKFQFEDWKNFQVVVPTYLKPTNIVGGYGHLNFRFEDFDGGLTCRDVRVNVEKV